MKSAFGSCLHEGFWAGSLALIPKAPFWAGFFELFKRYPGVVLGVLCFLFAIGVSWILCSFFQRKVYLTAVKSLLTPAEMRFYSSLGAIAPEHWLVLTKVRIADLVEVSSAQPAARQKVFRSIAAKHVDFVLANRATLQPQLVVELDDSSHQREDRRKRDIYVDQIFARAGLPILRVRAAQHYNSRDLAYRIEQTLTTR